MAAKGSYGGGAEAVHSSPAETELPLQSLESLLSMEKLDRASPDLWPEQIPGISGFAPRKTEETVPPWKLPLSAEDYNNIQKLSMLSPAEIIMEVKKIHNLAYQLGTEEAKEMTRGKYLNIFSSRRPRTLKE